jgi:hypothetical protein
VESPGTAPGSDPIITSAFMSIVPKNTLNIGEGPADFNGIDATCCDFSSWQADKFFDSCPRLWNFQTVAIHRVLEHPTFDGLTSDRRTIQLTA